MQQNQVEMALRIIRDTLARFEDPPPPVLTSASPEFLRPETAPLRSSSRAPRAHTRQSSQSEAKRQGASAESGGGGTVPTPLPQHWGSSLHASASSGGPAVTDTADGGAAATAIAYSEGKEQLPFSWLDTGALATHTFLSLPPPQFARLHDVLLRCYVEVLTRGRVLAAMSPSLPLLFAWDRSGAALFASRDLGAEGVGPSLAWLFAAVLPQPLPAHSHAYAHAHTHAHAHDVTENPSASVPVPLASFPRALPVRAAVSSAAAASGSAPPLALSEATQSQLRRRLACYVRFINGLQEEFVAFFRHNRSLSSELAVSLLSSFSVPILADDPVFPSGLSRAFSQSAHEDGMGGGGGV